MEIVIGDSKCINCMKCLNEICIADAINFKDEKIQINQNKCRGYGLSVNTCKQNAITLKYDDKSTDSIVNRLYNLVEL
ncbi:polyferredoxin [Methanobrevibacter sp. TLL-48-HuF1]|uniref:indolepyruvate ferredoxin oxidoreductase subunit alpha n=2 Tax=Methanobrevibacter TaxID=2172 RepID=UPI00202735E2|nr:polyferredoxin [Methanobrevibacter sp. TLL-48-HuF1]